MIVFISNISLDVLRDVLQDILIVMKILCYLNENFFPCYIIILTCNIAFKQNEIFMHIR